MRKDIKVLAEMLKNSEGRKKQEVFNQIFKMYEPKIKAHVNFKRGRKPENDDIVMRTMQKVYDKIHMFDSEKATFNTWIYAIARNLIIDQSKKDRYEVLSLDALSDKTSENNDHSRFEIKSDTLTPVESISRNEEIEIVRRVIAGIKNDNIRKAMTLTYIEGFNGEEVAKKMGYDKKSSTPRINLKRGREIVKEKLEQINFDTELV